MPLFTPTIPLEQELGKQIYNALQGEIVEKILKSAKDGAGDEYWRSHMEGHCMKVERERTGRGDGRPDQHPA